MQGREHRHRRSDAGDDDLRLCRNSTCNPDRAGRWNGVRSGLDRSEPGAFRFWREITDQPGIRIDEPGIECSGLRQFKRRNAPITPLRKPPQRDRRRRRDIGARSAADSIGREAREWVAESKVPVSRLPLRFRRPCAASDNIGTTGRPMTKQVRQHVWPSMPFQRSGARRCGALARYPSRVRLAGQADLSPTPARPN